MHPTELEARGDEMRQAVGATSYGCSRPLGSPALVEPSENWWQELVRVPRCFSAELPATPEGPSGVLAPLAWQLEEVQFALGRRRREPLR